MNDITTPAKHSPRLQNLHTLFDKAIDSLKALPALYANDYDFYAESVLKLSPWHMGKIYYKGFEVRKTCK